MQALLLMPGLTDHHSFLAASYLAEAACGLGRHEEALDGMSAWVSGAVQRGTGESPRATPTTSASDSQQVGGSLCAVDLPSL